MRFLGRRNGLVLGVMAQFLQYGAALLLLPLILARLSPEQVGVWYIFVAVQGLAMLMDFGFQPSFARSFALVFSGSQELTKEGLTAAKGGTVNYALVAKVLLAARVIYAGASLVVLVVLLTLGTLYIWSVVMSGGSLEQRDVMLAWVIFSFAVSVNLYLMWVSPLLIGADKVDKNYLYLIANRGTFFLAGAVLLIQGYGLSGLAIAFLLGPLAARLAVAGFLHPILRDIRRAGEPDLRGARKELVTIWHNSKKMGLVSIGAYLITRYNIFVVSHFIGLAAAASYGLTVQVLMAISSISQMPFQINVPTMVRARLGRNICSLRHTFLQSTTFYCICFTIGAVLLILAGDDLLVWVGSDTKLLEPGLVMLLSVIFLLEGNHANSALTISTANKVPFVYPALLSGGAIFVLSTLSGFLGWGLLGVILSQGLVQLSYNNWKWPLMVAKEISSGARSEVKCG